VDSPARISILILIVILGSICTSAAKDPVRGFYSNPPIKFNSQEKPTLPQDRFIAPDKAQHFMGSLISTVFFYKIFESHTDVSPSGSKYLGSGITLGLGIGKEIFDSTEQNNHFSWKDLIADAAGVALGLIIANQP
jgi:putative lipoprotein